MIALRVFVLLVFCAGAQAAPIKEVFENGFTTIVLPTESTGPVAFRLYVHAGSRDESEEQRGIAHLLEHMVLFKETERFSESDFYAHFITKISGYTNASTSYDRTCFVVDAPACYWHHVIPAQCEGFSSSRLVDDQLNSELKAVIQELKMGRDSLMRVLFLAALSKLFAGHPYEYPVIGFRDNLWNTHSVDLMRFYKKHYVPNNAVLVVVGNVDSREVLAQAKEHFGALPAAPEYHKEATTLPAVVASDTTLYRSDVVQPNIMLAWRVPGQKEVAVTSALELLPALLINGNSRLYRLLVEEKQWVDSVGADANQFEDAGMLHLIFSCKSIAQQDEVIALIMQELQERARTGFSHEEYVHVMKGYLNSVQMMREDNGRQADLIGLGQYATHDEQYYEKVFSLIERNDAEEILAPIIQKLLSECARERMITVRVLPALEAQQAKWLAEQQQQDAEDTRFLSTRVRTTPVEGARFFKDFVPVKKGGELVVPQQVTTVLPNGVQVVYHSQKTAPLVAVKFHFGTKDILHDNTIVKGILASMLLEGGTRMHTAQEVKQKILGLGATLRISFDECEGVVPAEHLYEFLEIIRELYEQPMYCQEALDRIKSTYITNMHADWLDDEFLIKHMMQHSLYDTSYPATIAEEEEMIKAITQEGLREIHAQMYVPHAARIFLVGDIERYPDFSAHLERTWGTFGAPIKTASVTRIKKQYLTKDQVNVVLSGPSIPRNHPDANALFLYFVHLHKRLFDLRERTGIFYGIDAQFFKGADVEGKAGFWCIKTLVSPDRLAEVYALLSDFIMYDIEAFTEDDLIAAYESYEQQIIRKYSTQEGKLQGLAALYEWNRPAEYELIRLRQLKQVPLAVVKAAVKRVFSVDNMHVSLVGRVGDVDTCSEEVVIPTPLVSESQCRLL